MEAEQLDIDTLLIHNELPLAAEHLSRAIPIAHAIASHRGWWTDINTGGFKDRNDGELIALMHSELSEALEGVRKDSQDDHLPEFKSVEVELADTLIRIFDYAEARKLRLAEAFKAKCLYNLTRSDHSISARKETGGKKF